MEMPIIKPSMVSYADELNFAQLLKDLLKDKHNGFIRVTSGSNEGYILFKDGEQVAASYDRHSKSEAVESIKSAMEENNTVIEVFKVRKSQVDYLVDINKPFLMEADYDFNQIIDELKESDEDEIELAETKSASQALKNEPEPELESDVESSKKPVEPVSESLKEKSNYTNPEPEVKTISEPVEQTQELPKSPNTSTEESELTSEEESSTSEEEFKAKTSADSITETSATTKTTSADSTVKVPQVEIESSVSGSSKIEESPEENGSISLDTSTPPESLESPSPSSIESLPTSPTAEVEPEENVQTLSDAVESDESSEKSEKPESQKESMDRSKLLKKYGIKEINENEVDNILFSYKGGSIDDDDIEKIELNLMNKIKKSVFGIPKIRGAEVMVFLDNAHELSGNINIIIEYEAKGFFSRLIGESRDIDNLRRQVINIAQIEIKKSFRKYPEIIDKFEINVEIS